MSNYPKKGQKGFQSNGGKTKSSHGYIKLYLPDHDRADSTGYVYEHILKCEAALGKPLPIKAEPHHINGKKGDNNSGNLVLCQDRAYHMLIHKRMRAKKQCGFANWEKCSFCKQWKPKDNMITYDGVRFFHKRCKNEYQNQQYALRVVRAVEPV